MTPSWSEILVWVLVSFLLLVWLYIAVRLVTAAKIRSEMIYKKRRKSNGTKTGS